MNEEQAYEKIQDLIELAKELIDSGHYTFEEVVNELSCLE